MRFQVGLFGQGGIAYLGRDMTISEAGFPGPGDWLYTFGTAGFNFGYRLSPKIILVADFGYARKNFPDRRSSDSSGDWKMKIFTVGSGFLVCQKIGDATLQKGIELEYYRSRSIVAFTKTWWDSQQQTYLTKTYEGTQRASGFGVLGLIGWEWYLGGGFTYNLMGSFRVGSLEEKGHEMPSEITWFPKRLLLTGPYIKSGFGYSF